MKQLTLFILLFSSFNFCFGQKITVTDKSDFVFTKRGEGFTFLEEISDTVGLNYIATITIVGGEYEKDIRDLYRLLKTRTNSIGGNSFRFLSFSPSSNTLAAKVYYATNKHLFTNSLAHQKSVVYLFGSVVKSEKTIDFKVNGEKIKIPRGSFYAVNRSSEEPINIRRGEVLISIEFAANQTPIFLGTPAASLVDPYAPLFDTPTVYNSGPLQYIDENFGYLLTKALTPYVP